MQCSSTRRTFENGSGRVVQTVPFVPCSALEVLHSCITCSVLEGDVVDAGLDDGPRHPSPPKFHLSLTEAVLEEVSGIEHVRMPDHDDICFRDL